MGNLQSELSDSEILDYCAARFVQYETRLKVEEARDNDAGVQALKAKLSVLRDILKFSTNSDSDQRMLKLKEILGAPRKALRTGIQEYTTAGN